MYDNNITIENFINFCNNMMIVNEGLIKRILAKSSISKIAQNIPNLYASSCYRITEDDAKSYINKVKNTPSKKPDVDTLLAACAILNISQNNFIKLIKNFDDARSMKYIRMVYDDNFENIDEVKSNQTKDKIDKLKLKVVEEDGAGNCLLYSISNGKFYDWDHERYNGIDEMLKHGVSYKDMMNGIIKARKEYKEN